MGWLADESWLISRSAAILTTDIAGINSADVDETTALHRPHQAGRSPPLAAPQRAARDGSVRNFPANGGRPGDCARSSSGGGGGGVTPGGPDVSRSRRPSLGGD